MQTEPSLHKDPRQLNKQDLIEIYKLLNPRLFRYAFRLLGDSDLAEDCVAETFSRFLTALKSGFGPSYNAKAYLYQIAHNWIMDYYRNSKPEENFDYGRLSVPSENPAVAAIHNIERDRVRKALLKLPTEQRQVILLRFYEEWPHEETASAIGKSVEATRAIQYRALKGLHRMLFEDEE
jgi:RNA polymerase sigma-70 factor, ECF subfamily